MSVLSLPALGRLGQSTTFGRQAHVRASEANVAISKFTEDCFVGFRYGLRPTQPSSQHHFVSEMTSTYHVLRMSL